MAFFGSSSCVLCKNHGDDPDGLDRTDCAEGRSHESQEGEDVVFGRRSSCSPTFPTSCSPPATPSCSSGYATAETPLRSPRGEALCARCRLRGALGQLLAAPAVGGFKAAAAARDLSSRGLRGRFIAEWKTQRNPLNSLKRGSYFTHFRYPFPKGRLAHLCSNGGKDAQRGAHRRQSPRGFALATIAFLAIFAATAILIPSMPTTRATIGLTTADISNTMFTYPPAWP